MKDIKSRFKNFLKENVKAEFYNEDAYFEDLINQYNLTGHCQYELGRFETKSGNPELFDYDEQELDELK